MLLPVSRSVSSCKLATEVSDWLCNQTLLRRFRFDGDEIRKQQFASTDGNILRRVETKFDAVSGRLDDSDFDVFANTNRLAGFSCQNQHLVSPSVCLRLQSFSKCRASCSYFLQPCFGLASSLKANRVPVSKMLSSSKVGCPSDVRLSDIPPRWSLFGHSKYLRTSHHASEHQLQLGTTTLQHSENKTAFADGWKQRLRTFRV